MKLARIGLSPAGDMTRIASLIKPFRATHADAEIIFKECVLDDLSQRLLTDQVDIAIWPKADHGAESIFSVELYSETLMYIPRGEDPRAPSSAGAVPIAALAGETFVLPHGTCGLAQVTETLFAKHSVAINAYPGRALVTVCWKNGPISASALPCCPQQAFDRPRDVCPADRNGPARKVCHDDGVCGLEGFSRHTAPHRGPAAIAIEAIRVGSPLAPGWRMGRVAEQTA